MQLQRRETSPTKHVPGQSTDPGAGSPTSVCEQLARTKQLGDIRRLHPHPHVGSWRTAASIHLCCCCSEQKLHELPINPLPHLNKHSPMAGSAVCTAPSEDSDCPSACAAFNSSKYKEEAEFPAAAQSTAVITKQVNNTLPPTWYAGVGLSCMNTAAKGTYICKETAR